MKKLPFVLLLFSLLYHGRLFSQNNTTVIVKAGQTIKEAVPTADLYEYPQFTPGAVFYKDGHSSHGALNYNRFLDGMEFITAKGDTLTLINQKNIDLITIATDSFYYDEGYLKLVHSTTHVKLGVKRMLRMVDKQRIGAYGMATSTESISAYSSYYDGIKNYNTTAMQQVVLAKEVQYYIGDSYNHFAIADKKNVLKLFPKQHQAVVNYLKENPVVFTNKEDLEQLVQFLNNTAYTNQL